MEAKKGQRLRGSRVKERISEKKNVNFTLLFRSWLRGSSYSCVVKYILHCNFGMGSLLSLPIIFRRSSMGYLRP